MMNKRLVWMFVVVVLAIACGKKDKEKAGTSTAARDTVASSPATVAYRAFGNEPFWSVTINADGLHFVSPADTVGIHFPPIEPMAMGDTLHWAAKTERGAIDVRPKGLHSEEAILVDVPSPKRHREGAEEDRQHQNRFGHRRAALRDATLPPRGPHAL